MHPAAGEASERVPPQDKLPKSRLSTGRPKGRRLQKIHVGVQNEAATDVR
jgi:hypothetical protein